MEPAELRKAGRVAESERPPGACLDDAGKVRITTYTTEP